MSRILAPLFLQELVGEPRVGAHVFEMSHVSSGGCSEVSSTSCVYSCRATVVCCVGREAIGRRFLARARV